jgi:hypothetical protein
VVSCATAMRTDEALYEVESALLAFLAGLFVVTKLVDHLGRRPGREGLLVPVLAAFGIRVAATLGVGALGSLGSRLRGPDDAAFLDAAQAIADEPLGSSAWGGTSEGALFPSLLAIQIRLMGDPGATSLRLVQCLVATIGIAFIGAAVADLAGSKAGVVAAWILAVEPSNVFFSTILQKESFVILGEGLVLFGVIHGIANRTVLSVCIIALGLVLVLAVRPYAALFLLCALILVALHLGVRRLWPHKARIAVATIGIAICLVGLGLAVRSAVERQLERLQTVQDLQLAQDSKLDLAPVDLTTPSGLAAAVPQRLYDFFAKPYPWQLANVEQRLGAIGTVITWTLALLVLAVLLRNRRFVLSRGWPMIYVMACLVVGYAITITNSGTGFRHRIHFIVVLAVLAGIAYASTRAVDGRRVRGTH